MENDGFAHIWKSLNIPTQLPTRQNVSINALDDMHNVLKDRLISELKNSAGDFETITLKVIINRNSLLEHSFSLTIQSEIDR